MNEYRIQLYCENYVKKERSWWIKELKKNGDGMEGKMCHLYII